MSDSLFFKFLSQPSILVVLDYLIDLYGSPVTSDDISLHTSLPLSNVLAVLSVLHSMFVVFSYADLDSSGCSYFSLSPESPIVQALLSLDESIGSLGSLLPEEAFDVDD